MHWAHGRKTVLGLSREIFLWLPRNAQDLWKKIHPTTSWLAFKKWALSVLDVLFFGQTASPVQIKWHPLQFHYCSVSCSSGLPWVSATSGIEGRGGLQGQRGFYGGVAESFGDFLPLSLLLVWAEESVMCWAFALSWNSVLVREEESMCADFLFFAGDLL